MKYGEHKNGFFLPNELFQLGLDYGELAVYSFLKRCENRKTHQCWPSIKTIGQAVGMSENTVRKYIRHLEERALITTEPTEVITKSNGRRNGNLLFTLRPIGEVIDDHYASQLEELELTAERQRVANLLREQESPRDRLWAAVRPFGGWGSIRVPASRRAPYFGCVAEIWQERISAVNSTCDRWPLRTPGRRDSRRWS